jgi:hypothetical protein
MQFLKSKLWGLHGSELGLRMWKASAAGLLYILRRQSRRSGLVVRLRLQLLGVEKYLGGSKNKAHSPTLS